MPAAVGLAQSERNQRSLAKTMESLSTGLRINRASDDAAGLSISEKIRSQVRGTNRAKQNVSEAVSLLNIAEGAMNEISAMLQRGRELAIQASNDTLTDNDRTYLHQEFAALRDEIDRINDSTQYNGKALLEGSVDGDLAAAITEGLQRTWLEDSVTRINAQYGLVANNANMEVVLENGITGATAYVQSTGLGGDMELHIDTSSSSFSTAYDDTTNEHGGTGPFYSDRVIAHEMVHAVMAQNMDISTLPKWFREGTAELIHGADERLEADLGTSNPTAAQAATFLNNANLTSWSGTSEQYSAAYAALSYLNQDIINKGNTMTDLMTDLKTVAQGGNNLDLDTAIANQSNFASAAAFLASVTNVAGGGNHVAAVMNFDVGAETDTGAIGGGALTAESVIFNSNNPADTNPTNFNITFADTADALMIQIGPNANSNHQLEISTSSVSSSNLGINEDDLSTSGDSARIAIGNLDDAIESVNGKRAGFGVLTNRLEHTLSNLANSEYNLQDAEARIRDVDFAMATTEFSKQQIMQNSIHAVIAQANAAQANVLTLLA